MIFNEIIHSNDLLYLILFDKICHLNILIFYSIILGQGAINGGGKNY